MVAGAAAAPGALERLGAGLDGRRGRVAATLLLAAVLAAMVALMSLTGPWQFMDRRVYDYLSTTLPPALPADGPLIVAIDEPSLAEVGRQWPWPREMHAQLIEALRKAGARRIGFDIIFAEPSNPASDEALAAAMGPDVVLAADESSIETPQATQIVRVEPLPQLTERGAVAGMAALVLDADAAARRVPRYPDGFAARLIGADSPPDVPPGALMQAFGPARTYPTVSYYQALDPENFLPPGTFSGRTVIVGLSMQSAAKTDMGGADQHATSWTTRTGRLVAGAEIHAAIFDNLRTKLFVTPASAALGIASIAVAALAAASATRRRTGWLTVVQAVAAAALAVAASFLLVRFGRFYVPPLAPAFAFALVAGARGAWDYGAERRLRRGITRAFSQYLPPALVQRLARHPERLKLGGEKRTLTILFCDVRGFTSISESLKDDPERLTGLINRLLDPLSEAILATGGTIDKYIGDCVMAFWNAPLDDPDHAPHAVEAALGMMAALEALNGELAAEAAAGEPAMAFRIGIGINTGSCVVGNMGSAKRFDYTALGDAVNLASRLEGLTKDYAVTLLLGEETARLARQRFPVLELGRAQVKGKAEAVAVSTVIPDASPEAVAAHAVFIGAFYGGEAGAALARLRTLPQTLPALAGYYGMMSARLSASVDREAQEDLDV